MAAAEQNQHGQLTNVVLGKCGTRVLGSSTYLSRLHSGLRLGQRGWFRTNHVYNLCKELEHPEGGQTHRSWQERGRTRTLGSISSEGQLSTLQGQIEAPSRLSRIFQRPCEEESGCLQGIYTEIYIYIYIHLFVCIQKLYV